MLHPGIDNHRFSPPVAVRVCTTPRESRQDRPPEDTVCPDAPLLPTLSHEPCQVAYPIRPMSRIRMLGVSSFGRRTGL